MFCEVANRKSLRQNVILPKVYTLWYNTEATPYLRNIINRFWTDASFDLQIFCIVILKIFPQKGDILEPKKWRDIALLDICSKVISSIIAIILGEYFTEFKSENQCGSAKWKGCQDANFVEILAYKQFKNMGNQHM